MKQSYDSIITAQRQAGSPRRCRKLHFGLAAIVAALFATPANADARWIVMDDSQCRLTWRSNGDIDYRICRYWDFVAAAPRDGYTIFIRKDGLRCLGSVLRIGERLSIRVADPCNDSFVLDHLEMAEEPPPGARPPRIVHRVRSRVALHARPRAIYERCAPGWAPPVYGPPPPPMNF